MKLSKPLKEAKPFTILINKHINLYLFLFLDIWCEYVTIARVQEEPSGKEIHSAI